MLAVLQKGLEDQSNGRFIFGTGNTSTFMMIDDWIESCLPVCSLQEAGDELFAYDVSWADAYSMPKVEMLPFFLDPLQSTYEEQQCFLAVNPLVIPKEVRLCSVLPSLICSMFGKRSLGG